VKTGAERGSEELQQTSCGSRWSCKSAGAPKSRCSLSKNFTENPTPGAPAWEFPCILKLAFPAADFDPKCQRRPNAHHPVWRPSAHKPPLRTANTLTQNIKGALMRIVWRPTAHKLRPVPRVFDPKCQRRPNALNTAWRPIAHKLSDKSPVSLTLNVKGALMRSTQFGALMRTNLGNSMCLRP